MHDATPAYDVVTLGETMLRFTPPAMLRFEQSSTVDMHVGGSESNTAVGLARLGRKVAWLSRLTDNALGRHIANSVNRYSVDTSHVHWTNQDRVGLYYLEVAKPPRGSSVIYDRKGSAMANMRTEDLPLAIFQPNGARLFHTTGITLGISSSAAATAYHAMKLAKQANWLVSFDTNYRTGLWDATAARQGMLAAFQTADIIFAPARDLLLMFSDQGLADEKAILLKLAASYPQAIWVMTMGDRGAMLACGVRSLYQPAYKTELVERLGGGDAFSAGFLSRYLELNLDHSTRSEGRQARHGLPTETTHPTQHLQSCLEWGCSVAALKYTILGDLPLVDRQQVERLLTNQSDAISIQR